MATKADRGTKRTCQDASCAVRFYDLARDPITCPVCGSIYKIIAVPPPVSRRPARTMAFPAPVAPKVESEEVASDAADEEDETAAAGEEALLEDDDDDSGVADIVSEPEDEEPH